MGGTQLGIAIPNFWFAMLLVLVFAVNLRWFSAGGFPGLGGPRRGDQALTLPAIALALPQASILARVMRSALLETLGQDYIRTARAKGLSRRQAVLRHALRNALIPVLTIIGLQFSFLLAGAIIIENVFFLPGLGRLIFQGITQRDLIVVESVTMLLVFAVILVTFLVDLAYASSTRGCAGDDAMPKALLIGARSRAVFLAAALCPSSGRRMTSPASRSPTAAAASARPTCSAPTSSAATCCRC
jgi:peptide/nickel transport system permease protein